MDTDDPPCDFSSFVAQRRGISHEQAERLIQCWLRDYLQRAITDTAGRPERYQCTIPDAESAAEYE
jgi:hypothetical protein